MALKLTWSKRSKKSFDSIVYYLGEQYGENVKLSFVKKSFKIIEILRDFPEIGTVEVKEKGIRGFLHKTQ